MYFIFVLARLTYGNIVCSRVSNIPHAGSFLHFVIFPMCVFVYDAIGDISFDILGPRAFREYMVCMI